MDRCRSGRRSEVLENEGYKGQVSICLRGKSKFLGFLGMRDDGDART